MIRSVRYAFLIQIVLGITCCCTGCYTYEELPEDDQTGGYPNTGTSVRINLKDGSTVESPAYAHLVTKEPVSLISGVGQDRMKSTTFKGGISSGELDSTKVVTTADGASLVCWLKNKTSIAFKEGQYLRLTMQDEPGFWCSGRKTSADKTSLFRGRLTLDDIAGFEVRTPDYETMAYIVAPVALFFLAIEAVRGRFPGLTR